MKELISFFIASLLPEEKQKEVSFAINEREDAIEIAITAPQTVYPILVGSHGLTVKAMTSLARFHYNKAHPDSLRRIHIRLLEKE
jgi:predicted RNA-binding protein Jag